MIDPDLTLSDTARESSRWLRMKALPLWASRGFDSHRDAFEEQLDFSGSPVTTVPRRLMVQARQVSVYAAAALSGAYPDGAEMSQRAAHAMIRRYLEADGAPGWVFSIDRAGRVIDVKRDLYAHAFAIFGLAWAMRLEPDRKLTRAITSTFNVLDRHFADATNGGYWDCLPRPDELRRQNPHMHLFEALLGLFEATRSDEALDRCHKLHALALRRFFDPGSGTIRELFDNAWAVHPAPGLARVEPGHLFEWAWLLRRYESATGFRQDETVSKLVNVALRYGVDAERGRVVDEIADNGAQRALTSRCWPHTEALKAIAEDTSREDRAKLLGAILWRILTVFCPERLGGGWIDHVDANDAPISTVMPASSLYHIFFGLDAVRSKIVRGGSAPEG